MQLAIINNITATVNIFFHSLTFPHLMKYMRSTELYRYYACIISKQLTCQLKKGLKEFLQSFQTFMVRTKGLEPHVGDTLKMRRKKL